MDKVPGSVLRPPEPSLQFLQTIPYVIWMLATLWTAPLEMGVLRIRFGTRYFSPPVVFASLLIAEMFNLVGLFVNAYFPSYSMFGMTSVTLAFRAACVIHFIRLLPKFRDLSKERLSTTDGPGWPIFAMLPHSDSWLVVRSVMEPGAVLIALSVLYTLHILSGFAAFYLTLSAFALCIKVGTLWWQGFQLRRGLADAGPFAEAMEEMQSAASDDDVPDWVVESFGGVS